MAIALYSDLISAVSTWMARSDSNITGNATDFIALAEARLNRELDYAEVDVTLNGTTDSSTIDISSLSLDKPIALFLAQTGLDEVEVTPKAPGTFPIAALSSRPRYYSVDLDGLVIQFDRALDGDYPFRFRYSQRFALSDSAPTNWLLTNHPDVYLAATLVWGGMFDRDSDFYAQWQPTLESALPQVRHQLAQAKRANLTIDQALQRIGIWPMRGSFNSGTIDFP